MSSATIDGLTVPQYSEYLTATRIQVAVVCLFVYEYIITFGYEAKYFWGRKINGAAILLYLNRYISLLLYLLDMLSAITLSDESCLLMQRTLLSIEMIPYFVFAAFSGLRAFALCNSWMLSTFIFLLACVPIAMNYVDFHFDFTGVNLPILGCQLSDTVTLQQERSFVIASRTCLIAADCLLIFLTWRRLYSPRQVGDAGRKNSFSTVLLRDGTIYFVVIGILNVLHFTLTLLSETIVLQDTSIVTELTEPMTTILISRFLFHLQAADRASLDMDSSDSHEGLPETSSRTNISSVVFDRIVGSLSADIAPEDLLGTADEDSEDYAEKSDFVGTTQTEYLEEPVEKGKSVNEMQEVNALDFGTRASSNTLRGLDTVEEVV